MSFAVVANVPPMYRWDKIKPIITNILWQQGIDEEAHDGLLKQYAWLVQVTSWHYGVDWDPSTGVIALEVPFAGPLSTVDTTKDKQDYDRDIAQDEISLILTKCMEKVTIKRLLAQFQRV